MRNSTIFAFSAVIGAMASAALIAGAASTEASELAAPAQPVAAPTSVDDQQDPFPLRKKYPQLECISTEQMEAMRSTSIVIDARNTVEFDVIHIDGSVSVPASFMKRDELLKVRAADGDTPLIFYCNGVTCTKSYKGCEKARAYGFENIYVYDAGVLTWARENPSDTIFFGKAMSAKTVDKQLISKDEFATSCLDTAEFISRAQAGGWKVFDMRDRDERSKNPIKLKGLVKCDIDQFVAFLGKPGAVPKEKVLVMDWVGKQVKWLQYHLEREGHTEYYFLSGGIKQWIADGYDERGKFIGKPEAK